MNQTSIRKYLYIFYIFPFLSLSLSLSLCSHLPLSAHTSLPLSLSLFSLFPPLVMRLRVGVKVSSVWPSSTPLLSSSPSSPFSSFSFSYKEKLRSLSIAMPLLTVLQIPITSSTSTARPLVLVVFLPTVWMEHSPGLYLSPSLSM